MSEAPEIPEAKDRFEKAVAITIAVMAVFLSWISNRGDDAKTNAIIKTNEATNTWGHFQSKSIKERLIEVALDLDSNRNGAAADGEPHFRLTANLRNEIDRYRNEKADIEKVAEKLQAEAVLEMRINHRSAKGSLMLQVAIVIASMAMLARSKSLWIAGILLAAAGSAIGISAYFM
jgi:hypothetical protein